MVIKPEPRKNYRARDGTLVTEYEACVEALKTLEAQKAQLEEKIELMRIRIATAEGHP